MEKILIGKIVKPQGIKGEVKAALNFDAVSLAKIKFIYLDGVRTAVDSIRADRGFAYIKFSTVTDRNHAELLRNKELYAEKADVNLDDGDYLVGDLTNSKILFENGDFLGTLAEIIQNNKSADVFIVETVSGKVLFPFLNDLVLKVDTAKKEITVKRRRYDEVALTSDSEEVR
jgi:16S rRNA processing protein RimM